MRRSVGGRLKGLHKRTARNPYSDSGRCDYIKIPNIQVRMSRQEIFSVFYTEADTQNILMHLVGNLIYNCLGILHHFHVGNVHVEA